MPTLASQKRPLTLYVLEQVDAPLALSGKQLLQHRQLALNYGRRLVAILDELQRIEYSVEACLSCLRPDQFALRRWQNRSTELTREFQRLTTELHWQACAILSPEQARAYNRFLAA